MSLPHDERPTEDDARFVRKLAALYRPPAPTPAARARFDARLAERLARGQRRPWLLAGATTAAATAALVLALWRGGEPDVREAALAAAEPAASTEETLLLLTNGPLEDPDEALPEDYQTLASLLE